MNVTSVAPQLPTTAPTAPSVEPRIAKAIEVTDAILFAQSLAAGPMPSVESIRQAAAGAHEVADEIWTGDARRGDIYGPLYSAASVNAKAGAEALDKAVDVLLSGFNDVRANDALDRQAILADTAFSAAMQSLTQLREYGA